MPVRDHHPETVPAVSIRGEGRALKRAGSSNASVRVWRWVVGLGLGCLVWGDWAKAEERHWAYQPLKVVAAPEVRDATWPRNEIDRFVLAQLESEGLSPGMDADRETLCRRVSMDLTGLAPKPEEVDAFLADGRPEALEAFVDRLLASPHFGEHWARHWLDVVRYAESVTLRGFIFKEAWRYRDYVIRAFSEDRPVDRFFSEQLAGDLLPADTLEERQRNLVATTFLMLGNTNLEEQDKRQMEMDVVDEQLDVIGKGFLGQTISCARCHDHKFDPIPIQDYYAMAGILKNSLAIRHDNVSMWVERPLPLEPEKELAFEKQEAAVAALKAEIQAAKTRKATNEWKALEVRLREAQALVAARPKVMGPQEASVISDLAVHRRGSVHTLGDVVARGYLSAVAGEEVPRPGSGESGRREMAAWITSPSNPLTGRVFVNRVWLWLMGEGLVRTPDNFGTTGDRPSHAALLDALAAAFVGVPPDCRSAEKDVDGSGSLSGVRPWSLKSLVRTMVLSRTYQLASHGSELARERDPANRLLSIRTKKRLSAEALRDGMLQASGRLRLDAPEGATFPADRAADYGFAATEPWRSVYVPVFRNALPEVFQVFDFPVASMVTGQRAESTVATQALFLLNDPFVRDQATEAGRSIAERVSGRRRDGIVLAYRTVLGRFPSVGELQVAERHFETLTEPSEGWREVIHALFASADFQRVH